MKNIIAYILILTSLCLSQDTRSTIFSTGTPENEEGYTISGENSIANKFSVSTDYAMEAFKVTMAMESQSGSVNVSIHNNNNNQPGEILGSWDLDLVSGGMREYLIYTFQDCILFDQGQSYWLSVKPNNETTIAKWIYSPDDSYTYSSSNDNQFSWETDIGYAGSCKVYAEAFFIPNAVSGDVNQDSSLNILDVVMIVSHISGVLGLTDEEQGIADINLDHSIDVLDIVQLITTIINTEHMPYFSLLDFNPNSDYYNQSIGPETFSNEVSCYYFGKQG